MKPQKNGKLKKGISLLLTLAMALSLIAVGSAAPWSNHPTIPTATSNTATFQVNSVNHTVTFGQTAVWTNKSAGEAAVNLSFDGVEYLKNEIENYDFALLMDGSGSPDTVASKESAKTFAANTLALNPDARFTVIKNDANMTVAIQNSNSLAAIQNAIDNLYLEPPGCDFVGPSCEVAYRLHKQTARENPLMIIVIGDGDFAYIPLNFGTDPFDSYIFQTTFKGDIYDVRVIRAPNSGTSTYTDTVSGITYISASEASVGQTYGNYIIKKNNETFDPGSSGTAQYSLTMRASWANILFMNENTLAPLREDGVVFATIATPKNHPGYNYTSYEDTLAAYPGHFGPREIADEGLCFEINGNTTEDYNVAFSGLETTIVTKAATMSTTIDSRYFTVDETALAEGLPTGCTYDIQNTTRGGVVVQDVQIIYQTDGEQTLNVSVSVPVTINADIPRSAFLEDNYLPVVYDGTAPNGVAGCLFTDLNGTNQNINTKQVYIDATSFVPGYDAALFEATTGNVILRGDWAEESSGDVVFWVSYDGAPITQDHLDAITFACAPALHWENIGRDFHTKGTAVLTGVTNGNFAEVKVAVEVKISGVSAITMDFESTQLAVGYVITPGDVSELYGTINAADQGALARVVNNVPGTVMPQKGLANNFYYEMMDMTKDNLLNAADVGALGRLVNQLAYIYNS